MRRENIYVFISSLVVYFIVSLISTTVYFANLDVAGININDYPQYRLYLYIGVILLAIGAILMTLMSYFLGKLESITTEGAKRSSVENLFWGFLYISLAAWINVFVFGVPGFGEISTDVAVHIAGAKIMPFVILTGLGNFVLMLGMYYIILFSLAEFKKIEITIFYKRGYVVLIILFLIAILPSNYYALIPPKEGLYTRPLLVFAHLILSFTLSFYSSYITFKAASKVEDRRYRRKLKLVGLGFILFILVFLIPALGIALAPGVPLFAWYTIGFMVISLAMIIVYLGFLTPSWFERFL